MYNDLLFAADGGQVSALCLLDLTAAFDTVDHDLQKLPLERQFGLRGVVLSWFRSDLSGRVYSHLGDRPIGRQRTGRQNNWATTNWATRFGQLGDTSRISVLYL